MNLPEFSSIWGPPAEVPSTLRFSDTPYAPFSKGDKLGKAADWAADPVKDGKDQRRTQGRGFRDPYHAYGASSTRFFTNEDNESSWSFNVVDSGTKGTPKPRGQQNAVLKTRGRMQGQQQQSAPQGRAIGQASSFANRSAGGGGYRRPGAGYADKGKAREPSVAIGPTWKLVQSNNFNELKKLTYNVPLSEGKTIGTYGSVQYFDRATEKITQPMKLKVVDSTVYNVTTSEDPVINKLAGSNVGQVFATDAILAVIMCTTKSNNPWDIVVNKVDGKIFFDKRDGGPLDFLTVDENSVHSPADDAENRIDSTSALSIEATYINQNFVANVVTRDGAKHDFENTNPFATSDDEPVLPKGYIYRQFNLEADSEKPPLELVVRCEIDAVVAGPDGDNFAIVRALNEYGGYKSLEWKDRFVNHRGAIVAAEMKNNLNKLSQWTVQALLSGSKALKIGFVSRVNAKEKTNHEIVGVLSGAPTQFATQLNLQMQNGWGIVRSLINIITSLEDGKYAILRDPNLQFLRVYQVPN